MKRSIILLGSESYLGAHIRERVQHEHELLIGVNGLSADAHKDSAIVWLPTSPLSSKKLVLEADRLLNPLQEVWVVYSPWMEIGHAEELRITSIEEAINNFFKAYLFLFREILLLSEEKEITLRTFFWSDTQSPPTPLLAAVYEGVASFLENLMYRRNFKNLKVFGYESFSDKVDDFIDFVLKNLNQSPKSRWYRFPEPLFPWQKRRRKRSLL